MRLLADENVPLPSVHVLRAAGVDVTAIAEVTPGIADAEVLSHSRRDGRILLTFDRDFGELVFWRGMIGQPCVIYCRFVPSTPTETTIVLQFSPVKPLAQ